MVLVILSLVFSISCAKVDTPVATDGKEEIKKDLSIQEDATIEILKFPEPVYYKNIGREVGKVIINSEEWVLLSLEYVGAFISKDMTLDRSVYNDFYLNKSSVEMEEGDVLHVKKVIVNRDKGKSRALYVICENKYEGWICFDWGIDNIGSMIGYIEINGEKIGLLECKQLFSTVPGTFAYSMPVKDSKNIIWIAEAEEKNPGQVNFKSICVVAEGFQGDWNLEHWVKVIDEKGRIGWISGDELSVERGGPKYLLPDNILKSFFNGP